MEILLIFPGFILSLILTVVYKRKLRKSQNKVHFYVARDKNKDLYLYLGKPIRSRVFECWIPQHRALCNEDSFSDISISSNIGINKNVYKDLTWEDEPVEVFLNMKY